MLKKLLTVLAAVAFMAVSYSPASACPGHDGEKPKVTKKKKDTKKKKTTVKKKAPAKKKKAS